MFKREVRPTSSDSLRLSFPFAVIEQYGMPFLRSSRVAEVSSFRPSFTEDDSADKNDEQLRELKIDEVQSD